MLHALVALYTSLSLVAATNIPLLGNVDFGKDSEQYRVCKGSDPKTTFAAIRYGDGPAEPVEYNQCVLLRRDGVTVVNAVFCQPATCYIFADKDCMSGPTNLAPVIVAGPIDFLNALDFAELLGQSAYCSPNNILQILK